MERRQRQRRKPFHDQWNKHGIKMESDRPERLFWQKEKSDSIYD